MKSEKKKVLQVLKGIPSEIPPVWLMRQAGRYLPEYMEIRNKVKDFLELCYTPHLAAEVTLQPIRRFNFDAAILFSDILVIPHALGIPLKFDKNQGPKLEFDTSEKAINEICSTYDEQKLQNNLKNIPETLKLIKKELPEGKGLIGFCGSPWTVAAYILEGSGSKDFLKARSFGLKNKNAMEQLLDLIEKSTISYLEMQIKAGAEIIMLFDSWAGILEEGSYENWVIKPNKNIVKYLKKKHPEIYVIAFPRNSGLRYKKFVENVPVDCISIDSSVPLKWAAEKLQKYCCVQGNLDPIILLTDKQTIQKETRKILDNFSEGAHIFNLGHGILPETNPDNVQFMLDEIRG